MVERFTAFLYCLLQCCGNVSTRPDKSGNKAKRNLSSDCWRSVQVPPLPLETSCAHIKRHKKFVRNIKVIKLIAQLAFVSNGFLLRTDAKGRKNFIQMRQFHVWLIWNVYCITSILMAYFCIIFHFSFLARFPETLTHKFSIERYKHLTFDGHPLAIFQKKKWKISIFHDIFFIVFLGLGGKSFPSHSLRTVVFYAAFPLYFSKKKKKINWKSWETNMLRQQMKKWQNK